MIRVVPATVEHAERMAPIMRREDQDEVRALGLTPLGALTHSIAGAYIAEAAVTPEDDVIAMWGACPDTLTGSKAHLWMLGTEAVPRHAKALLRGSRSFVAYVQRRFPVAECLVDMRYHQAMAWVQWLGFRQVAILSTPDTPFALCKKDA